MLGYLIVFLLIMSFAIGLSLFANRRIEETFPIAILSIIVIEYVFGALCNSLTPGFYISILVCIAGFVYSIADLCGFIRAKNGALKHAKVWIEFRDLICTPGIFFILLIFVWMYLINLERQVAVWDELSHWALTVKNMCYYNDFSFFEKANTTYKSYPPALSLWQYFVCRISGGYSDQAFYHAQSLLVMSLLMPFLKGYNWKRFGYSLAAFFILVFFPLSITFTYMVVGYSDLSLGFLSIFLLFEYYTVEEKHKFDYYMMCIISSVLTLTKASGISLCAIVLLVMFIDWLVKYKYLIKLTKARKDASLSSKPSRHTKKQVEAFGQEISLLYKKSFAAALSSLYVLSCMILAKGSWKFLLFIHHVPADSVIKSNYGFNLNSLSLFFTHQGPYYWDETWNNFMVHLFTVGYGKGPLALPLAFWLALFTVLAYCISSSFPDKDRFQWTVNILLICGIFYLLGLYFTYIFNFVEFEATNLSSFKRYSYSFYFLFVYFIMGTSFYKYETDAPFCFVKKKNAKWNKKYDWIWIPCWIAFLFLVVPIEQFSMLTWDVATDWEEEASYREVYTCIHDYDSVLDLEKDKIALIAQQEVGNDYYTLKFEMAPLRFADIPSVGKAFYINDFFTKQLTAEEWVSYLKEEDCTYVYVFRINDYFADYFIDLFEDPSSFGTHKLYRIVWEGDSMKLVYVEKDTNN